jgi:hypothetical protein
MHEIRFSGLGRLALSAALLIAAGCARDVSAPRATEPAATGGAQPETAMERVTCTASRKTLKVSCNAPEPVAAGPGASADIIYAGQNKHVTLTSSNVAYNGGTGQFTFDVTVKNLLRQRIGTTDGTTLEPGGIKVYFGEGPTVTDGIGVASVVPDGFSTFNGVPGLPYYQYNQVLNQGATSSAHPWLLVMPPTVISFNFELFISAPVQFPKGYVVLDGGLYNNDIFLNVDLTHQLTAAAETELGRVTPGAVIKYATTDPTCLTVNSSGLVTAGPLSCGASVIATYKNRTGVMPFIITEP